MRNKKTSPRLFLIAVIALCTLALSACKDSAPQVLGTLEIREEEVVKLYFGIDVDTGYTLEEIGHRFNLTRERVRQIKEKALKRLKHSTRSKR